MINPYDEIKELEKELRRLRIRVILIKIHMDILINLPFSKTAADIRKNYKSETASREQILSTLN